MDYVLFQQNLFKRIFTKKTDLILLGYKNYLKIMECKHCSNTQAVQTRQYVWLFKHDLTNFEVELCNECNQKTIECDYIRGHDWWDAFDDLCYTYLETQDYRDFWDTNTSRHFNMNVDQLREIRTLIKYTPLITTELLLN